ncbi:hypothetical protein LTR28_009066 [Elasticomyces elasticus]|nr:hypothetical protein LTR28_009066 [Elasticomyces elasticus]
MPSANPIKREAVEHSAAKRRKLSSATDRRVSVLSDMDSPTQAVRNVAPPVEIELTQKESILRQLLLDVAEYIDASALPDSTKHHLALPEELAKQKLVLRFVGGWVRDKLLGVPSDDIDVAINNMTGYDFGLRMKEYLDIPGNPAKYGLQGMGGLHKVEANPEKSKHLETVPVRIFGFDVDLVNLRTEEYSEDSRNPQMQFGTPEEDALRRDATVNAMFYNLTTSSIEDFTGRGYKDMQVKIIRTPLEPYQTFKDDPLRVLRLIRFASRLGYTIDPAAEESMKNPEIQAALKAKISRERIGKELEKMLKGPDPCTALGLIDRLGLYETIFSDPTKNNDKLKPNVGYFRHSYSMVHEITERDDATQQIFIRDAEDRYLAWQVAALVPWVDAPQQPPSRPGGKLPLPIAADVAMEGIKSTHKICTIVTAAVRLREEISGLVHELAEQNRRPNKPVEGEDVRARDVLGMAVRRWGSSWRTLVVFAICTEVADESDAKDLILGDYRDFLTRLKKLDLLDAYNLKPVLDGKALAKALAMKPGPWMKDALDVVMAWQLRNPDSASAEEAIQAVKIGQKHGELTSSLITHFLRLTIRPLFAKTSHPAVTAQGRKVTTTVLPKRFRGLEESEEVTKPWKGKDDYALALLRWIVLSLDERSAEQNWPLLIPPLLTIVDDTDAVTKAKGCELITSLFKVTPPSLLARTGLGEVFEEAVMPCLGYLPTLTPEADCIVLLSAAYPTLLALAHSKHPTTAPATTPNTALAAASRPRAKLLDALIRKGILPAYTHCSSNPRIVAVLLHNLAPILSALGVDAVKHLKHVVPTLSAVLGHPLGSAHLPTLLAAVRALQAVVLNCWPRMGAWRGEVLKGLGLCWVRVCEGGEGEGVAVLKAEIGRVVRMLGDAVGGEWDVEAEFGVVVGGDERAGGLFGDGV